MADRAILAVLPDPILCYKNAKYQQEQVNLEMLENVYPYKIIVHKKYQDAYSPHCCPHVS